jgi:hypothetical protein
MEFEVMLELIAEGIKSDLLPLLLRGFALLAAFPAPAKRSLRRA